MNKGLIFIAALNIAFLTSCGSGQKQAGEEYYDPAYRAKADSAYSASEKDRATAQAETGNQDLNTEKVGENASTHSADSEAPAAENDKSQASSPAKTAGTEPTEEKPAETPAAAPAQAKPAVAVAGNFEKGKALLSKSDCLACHKVDQKVVGPAYQDVAKKYEANEKNIAYLAGKIIKGGAGAWGDVPMSPHPTLSQGDAREMAKYILSLR